MTDRELLELAAKAAGKHVLREGDEWPAEETGWFYNDANGIAALYDRANPMLRSWSPLTDDGDALRLAVKLQIAVFMRVDQGRVFAGAPVGSWGLVELLLGNDHEASVRRAIVSAAAKLAPESAS